MSTLANTPSAHHSSPAMLPANGQPVTLAEQVDHEALAFRSRGDSIGQFIADHLDRLAQLVRWTGAETPDQHEERMEVWEDEIRAKWYDRGYEAGLEVDCSPFFGPPLMGDCPENLHATTCASRGTLTVSLLVTSRAELLRRRVAQ